MKYDKIPNSRDINREKRKNLDSRKFWECRGFPKNLLSVRFWYSANPVKPCGQNWKSPDPEKNLNSKSTRDRHFFTVLILGNSVIHSSLSMGLASGSLPLNFCFIRSSLLSNSLIIRSSSSSSFCVGGIGPTVGPTFRSVQKTVIIWCNVAFDMM